MGVEIFEFISDLNPLNPTGSDPKSEGDDHLRGIKETLRGQFPNLNAVVTSNPAELNLVDGMTDVLDEDDMVSDSDTAFVTQQSVKKYVDDSGLIGEIKMWPTSSVPAGYLECDGSTFVQATYPLLYAALGNSTTLPDMRGEFPRGWDNGKGTDPARAIGSSQSDAMLTHGHTAPNTSSDSHNHHAGFPTSGVQYVYGADTSGGERNAAFNDGYGSNGTTYPNTSSDSHSHTVTVNDYSGSTEVRPTNIALMFIIKHD